MSKEFLSTLLNFLSKNGQSTLDQIIKYPLNLQPNNLNIKIFKFIIKNHIIFLLKTGYLVVGLNR